jgi:hypothetical protein
MLADDVIAQGVNAQDIRKIMCEDLAHELKSAQKFLLDEYFVRAAVNVAHTRPSSIQSALKLCRLPYESVWFEFVTAHRDWKSSEGKRVPKKIGMYCKNLDDPDIILATFCWQSENFLEICPYSLVLDFSAQAPFLKTPLWKDQKSQVTLELVEQKLKAAWQENGIPITGVEKEAQASFEMSNKVILLPSPFFARLAKFLEAQNRQDTITSLLNQTQEDAWEELKFLVASLLLLNSKNRVGKEHICQHEANKSRVRKGKKPLYDYHVLKLNLSKAEKNIACRNSISSGDVRAHLVRGHFKVRSSGVFWWSPFLRGNLKRGFLAKDYNVVEANERRVFTSK